MYFFKTIINYLIIFHKEDIAKMVFFPSISRGVHTNG
jgi:hypothetical protein